MALLWQTGYLTVQVLLIKKLKTRAYLTPTKKLRILFLIF